MSNQKVVVNFARKNDSVILPSKIEENMGFDIYANFEGDYIVIKPNETKLIPTGLFSAFSSDYAIVLKERGSTGTKGMGQRAGVIDSGYRGEWFVPITNHNSIPIVIMKDEINEQDIIHEFALIYPYSKAICQAVLIPVPKVDIKEISVEELKAIPSVRKDGALGSSNK